VSERTNRVFTTEFKERAVLRLEAGEQFSALAAELGVRRKLLYDWSKSYRLLGVAGLNRKRGPKPGRQRSAPQRATLADPLAQAQARVAELERLVGRQQVDLDFFRRALRLTDAASPNGNVPTSTRSSK
jgi:transposase-like protein